MKTLKAKIVRWIPNQPNKFKLKTIEGILTEQIQNDNGEPGWHIMEQSTGFISRCWSSNGTLEHLRDIVL